jgi:hypothetical protein
MVLCVCVHVRARMCVRVFMYVCLNFTNLFGYIIIFLHIILLYNLTCSVSVTCKKRNNEKLPK